MLLWLAGFRGGFWSSTGPRWRDISLRRGRIAVAALAVGTIATTDTVAAAFAPALAGVIGLVALLHTRDPRPLLAGLCFGFAVVATVAAANVGTFVYHDFTGEDENNNITPVTLDGTLRVAEFIVFDAATDSQSPAALGRYGAIGNTTVDFEVTWISGAGVLHVLGDDVFDSSFEADESELESP